MIQFDIFQYLVVETKLDSPKKAFVQFTALWVTVIELKREALVLF